MTHTTERRSPPAGPSLLILARLRCAFAVGCVSVLAVGCGASTTTEAAAKKLTEAAAKQDVQSQYDQTGRLTRLTYDRDHDGKIDTWGFMDGARVVRVEVDENGDGKVDRWEYHKEVPADSTGSSGATGSMGSTGSRGVSAGTRGTEPSAAGPGVRRLGD